MEERYHAFLDESGQREYRAGTDRYYVVLGAIVRVEQLKLYETELSGVKRAFFGTPAVEIKSTWLRQPDKRKAKYLQPDGIQPRNSRSSWRQCTDGCSPPRLRSSPGSWTKSRWSSSTPIPVIRAR
jgi:hypothetical protein